MNTPLQSYTSSYAQGLISPKRKPNFPYKLAVAITSLTTSAVINTLSRTAKAILAFLLRLAETSSPTQPSWAFKATIAAELGMNVRTVYRGLIELEKAGLIERLPQTRNTLRNRFSMSKIRLTSQACQSLLTLQSDKMSRSYNNTLPCGSPRYNLTETVPSEAVDNFSDHSSTQHATPSASEFQTIAHRKVPREFMKLITEQALSLTGLFQLMKHARLAGQYLSDIVAARSQLLSRFRGRALYAYLRRLIQKPLDWGWIRQQHTADKAVSVAEQQAIEARQAQEAQLTAHLSALNGRTFTDASRVYQFYGEALHTLAAGSGQVQFMSLAQAEQLSICEKAIAGTLTEHPDTPALIAPNDQRTFFELQFGTCTEPPKTVDPPGRSLSLRAFLKH